MTDEELGEFLTRCFARGVRRDFEGVKNLSDLLVRNLKRQDILVDRRGYIEAGFIQGWEFRFTRDLSTSEMTRELTCVLNETFRSIME